MRRNARATSVAHVHAAVKSGNGEWVPWNDCVRNGWDRQAAYQLIEDKIIERRAETLTTDRSPGWLGRALQGAGFTPWSPEALEFESALRLYKAPT